MRRILGFLVGLALGAALTLGVLLALWFGIPALKPYLYPDNDIGWIEAVYTTKTRRLQESDRPRLILVGGSSVHFGLDARLLSERLGLAATNFGAHGSLGAHYMLDRVERQLAPGDVVLLTFEYPLFQGYPPYTAITVFYTAFHDKAFWWRMPAWALAECVPQLDLRSAWKALWMNAEHRRFAPLGLLPGPYRAENIDGYGVERGNRAERITPEMRLRVDTGVLEFGAFDPPPTVGRAVDRFVGQARARGVTLLAAFPPMVASKYRDDAAARLWFSGLAQFWTGRGVPVIGGPSDMLFAPDEAYDTMYHANERGMARVTDRLAGLLARSGLLRPPGWATGAPAAR